MRILALGPHPDDLEIGCGGTLLKYAQKGDEIYMMVMTSGGRGGDPLTRLKEQERAARSLGARDLILGDYRDTELPVHYNELIQKIERAIDKVRPDFIFVNHSDDTHQDHRTLAEATLSATRYIRNVLFYEVPTTRNFNPTVFVDIEGVLEEKLAVLHCHESQIMRTTADGVSVTEIARATAYFRGVQGRVRYAEGFVCLRLFINVLLEGAPSVAARGAP